MKRLDKSLLVATTNRDKLREIRQILRDSDWRVISLADIPSYTATQETGDTFLENALLKARDGFHHTGYLTLADDSGLEVEFLDGRPGVYSARYAGQEATSAENVDLLLKELKPASHSMRTAIFRCFIALVGPQVERWWEGESAGVITEARSGNSGFGYDPVFFSTELGMTFAEASPDEKNRVSHRGRALRYLKDVLTELA